MPAITTKRYQCSQCGHITNQETNHYGQTYSLGHYNCCPACPPYKKYSEFGGRTVWNCIDQPTKEEEAQPIKVSDFNQDWINDPSLAKHYPPRPLE